MSTQSQRKVAAKIPVSAHPAFPAIVALWFAALLGIGSMVLPVALFERTAEATGVSSVLTAAQPPLGFTARILVAAVAAALGAFAGIMIARKVAAAAGPKPTSRRAAAISNSAASNAKRPISAHEELGADSFDAAIPAAPARRRPLSMNQENARSDFLEFAPLPGQDDSRDPVEVPAAPVAEPAALELGAFAEEPAGALRSEAECADLGNISLGAGPVAGKPQVFADPETEPADEAAPSASPATSHERESESSGAAEVEAGRAPGEPALAQLVERFARALETYRVQGRGASDGPVPAVAPGEEAREGSLDEDREPQPVAAEQDTVAKTAAPSPLAVPAFLLPVEYDEGEGDDEEDALPDLDLTAALSRSRRASAPSATDSTTLQASALTSGEPDDAAVEPEAIDAGYSSLLAMRSPLVPPREAVRIDEDEDDGAPPEPVVVFPGQPARGTHAFEAAPALRDAAPYAPPARPFDAPLDRAAALTQNGGPAPGAGSPSAADTESALREALEKLQRLSGAA